MIIQYEFQRKENKYLIHTTLANVLREESHLYMPEAEYRQYRIRSIYFDSNNWNCFYDQVFKRLPRYKIRFRQYANAYGYMPKGFLEMKLKTGPYTIKHRFRIRYEWLDFLNDPEVMDEIVRLNVGNRNLPKVYHTLTNIISGNKLQPVLQVEYDRSSFEASNLRITIDSNLRFSALSNHVTIVTEKKKTGAFFSVLEIKSMNEQPEWLSVFRSHYGIRKRSFSKYCFGISLLYDPFTRNELTEKIDKESMRELLYARA